MIIVRLEGGMGNQMFQYALGRTLSIKYNIPLGLDLSYLLDRTSHPAFRKFVFRNYDLDVFNISAEIISPSKVPLLHRLYFSGKLRIYFDIFRKKFFRFRGIEKSFHFDPKIFSKGPNIYLHGNWQSPKYFESIKDLIHKEFTLKKPLPKEIKKLRAEISRNSSLCINVRRADFVDNSFHGTIGKEYYNQAIDIVTKLNFIDKIYIFSDDLKWCRENLQFNLPTIFVDHQYAGEKFENYLILMSACKNFIIPNSTFAWWAAWLSSKRDKIIVAPKKWFLDEKINTNDLIPKEWIRI